MLDFAEIVVINKFERRGAEDALRDVRRQYARNREVFDADARRPARVRHRRVAVQRRRRHRAVPAPARRARRARAAHVGQGVLAAVDTKTSTHVGVIVPPARQRYLAEITETIRGYHATHRPSRPARARGASSSRPRLQCCGADGAAPTPTSTRAAARDQPTSSIATVRKPARRWPATSVATSCRARPTDCASRCRARSVPKLSRAAGSTTTATLVRWLRSENLPGWFPFTAGVFPFKREGEDPGADVRRRGRPGAHQPALQAAVRGPAGDPAVDRVRLGHAVRLRPGRAPGHLRQGRQLGRVDRHARRHEGAVRRVRPVRPDHVGVDDHQRSGADDPGDVPQHRDRPAARPRSQRPRAARPTEAEAAEIRACTLQTVRGTVQADILKEDQGQNTCIFSTEFSLGVMADIAEWFVEHEVRNFYSVSISGYHIAEAGREPHQPAGVHAGQRVHLRRGVPGPGHERSTTSPPTSASSSRNGMDPEYTVLGRVARRIWAVAMRDRYGADERSQKLKYHVQTSGRSLHAQEMAFNDIRTTLQALCAIYDNANSLHTNAYDEAVTTPTAESVRRALAIQLVINREWGLAMNENPLQGSFIVEELTDAGRGGRAGRARAHQPSAAACSGRWRPATSAVASRTSRCSTSTASTTARCRSSGSTRSSSPTTTPTSSAGHRAGPLATTPRSRTSSTACAASSAAHADERPAALERLREAALDGDNLFDVLMDAVRSLQPRRDHRHAVRRRRPLPPQRLTRSIRRQTSEEVPWQVCRRRTPGGSALASGSSPALGAVQGRVHDSVIKLRPVVPAELPRELRDDPNFVVEVDALPGGYVCPGR